MCQVRAGNFLVNYVFFYNSNDPTWSASLRGVSGSVTYIILNFTEKSTVLFKSGGHFPISNDNLTSIFVIVIITPKLDTTLREAFLLYLENIRSDQLFFIPSF